MHNDEKERKEANERGKDEDEIDFVAYLEELRTRIIRVFVVFVAVFFVSFPFSERILELFTKPARALVSEFIFTKPFEAFVANLKMSLVVAVFVSFPVFVWEMWNFVAPALYPNERKIAKRVVLFVLALFVAGGLFGYFVVLPVSLEFLIKNFSSDLVKPMLTIGDFVSFVLRFTFAFGLAFEVPVVVVLLVATGLVERQTLKKARVWILVGSFVVGAILTPPDVLSQVMLAVPLIILWEIGLAVSKPFERDGGKSVSRKSQSERERSS